MFFYSTRPASTSSRCCSVACECMGYAEARLRTASFDPGKPTDHCQTSSSLLLTLRHSGDAFAASVSHGTHTPLLLPCANPPRGTGGPATPKLPPPPLLLSLNAAVAHNSEKLFPRQSQRPRLRERAILTSRFAWAAKSCSMWGWLTATCRRAKSDREAGEVGAWSCTAVCQMSTMYLQMKSQTTLVVILRYQRRGATHTNTPPSGAFPQWGQGNRGRKSPSCLPVVLPCLVAKHASPAFSAPRPALSSPITPDFDHLSP